MQAEYAADYVADYVIVGSGSAGSAMAARLSEAGASVLVLEYGGSDWGPLIQMPGALSYPLNMARYNWGFVTEPEPHLGNRRLVCPRGKVVGGSSSINGMVYVRGHARDFDHWAEQGAQGWSFADVAPYFERMECWHGPPPGPALEPATRPEARPAGEAAAERGSDTGWRGTAGPLHVTRARRDNALHLAFIEAGRQAGFELTADYNGAKQEGFGPMDMTVWRGRRWSAASAYLRPALRRRNCGLLRCLARRVIVEDGRATGVEIARGSRIETVRANREVILAASSINSPKLLMLSGIGPARHLAEHGLPVVADRPGVGQNLQDHLELYIQQACTQPITLYRYWSLLGKAWVGLRWLLTRGGPGASNQFQAAAFLRSGPGVEYPDIQYHFLPIAVRYDGRFVAEGHGFQAHVGPMRSPSRGTVTLASAEPAAPPCIRFNYMSDPQDWIDFRRCIRLTREIFAQPAFDAYRGPELAPGDALQSDDELDAFVRQHAESAYHPCGTCRMGRRDDPTAVVDPECRVIGVDRLRVVDSSIFPRITNGNLNAPAIMAGEKASDHILGRAPLAAANRPPWINPRWQSSDR